MSTIRTRALIILSLVGLMISMGNGHSRAALPCLAIMLWVGLEWLRFALAVTTSKPLFGELQRTIQDVNDAVQIIAVDRVYQVDCCVMPSANLSGLRLTIEDLIPGGCRLPTSPSWVVTDTAGSKVEWSYEMKPVVTGNLLLLGFQVRLSDRFGFFRTTILVRHQRQLTVLPSLIRPGESVSVLKRDNLQILNGGHRFRRSGSGMELLGIRDYRVGDPPRNIAWKATARRGQPMTCEFESEVPIRSTVIADLSTCQYEGRPGPATADRIIAAIASVTRVLLSQRDPVGCSLVAEGNRTVIRHGHGERQLARLFQTVFAHGKRHCAVTAFSTSDLIAATWNAASRRFPELLSPALNPPRVSGFLWGSRRRTLAGQRRQLAFLWTCLRNDPFEKIALLQEDDAAFRAEAANFVMDYSIGLRPPARRFDVNLNHANRHLALLSLCQALVSGTTRAKDNELFVVVSQIPSDDDDMAQFVATVRLVRAKYHRLVFVEAKPPELSLFCDAATSQVSQGLQRGILQRRRVQLKSDLTSLGAKMATLDDPRLLDTVLSELELLKHGRTGMTRSGSR
jgi:uncharacterized protein (DUF58 family)